MAYTAIDKPSDYFSTALWTGNGSGATISGVGFQPDWVWEKSRSATYNHNLIDSVRGANKVLESNNGETQATKDNTLMSFNSDGFVYGANAGWSNNNSTFVAWNWKAGTSFSNSAGANGADIASSGSVNTDAGFSIITATSNSSANKKIAHGLGAVPGVIISKNLDTGYGWDVYFKTLGYNASLQLNSVAAVRTGAWGSTTFTSTFFQTGDDYSSKNGSPYIYYCFTEKQGYSKFSQYRGNGNANGSFIYTGFSPAFLMIKQTAASNDWFMIDNKREPFNPNNVQLVANGTSASTNKGDLDLLSNGFKPRSSNAAWNENNAQYVYMAFAENPFTTSTGVPATAR